MYTIYTLMEIKRAVMIVKYFSDSHSIACCKHGFLIKRIRRYLFYFLRAHEERICPEIFRVLCILISSRDFSDVFDLCNIPVRRNPTQR